MTEIDESEHHATLICVAGKYAGKTFHVNEEATIGRDGENNILLDAMVVSNHHARVFFDDASASFVIEDLGSRTGIMVDDDFIDDRAVLHDGQQVTIANEFRFTFHIGTVGESDDHQEVKTPVAEPKQMEDTRPATSPQPEVDTPAQSEATPEPVAAEPEPSSPVAAATTVAAAAPKQAAGFQTYFLERTGNEGEQVTFSLTEGINLVGRDPSNTIHLKDGSVSRHHAVIVAKDGKLLVRDLDSKNHTFVDGVQVEHEREMHVGSVVLFGLMAFVVREQN